MDTDALKAIQQPLKEQYREDPDAAMITLQAQGSVFPESLTCSVSTGRALAQAGLHPATGGDGLTLCSGDMLLQALVACAGVTLGSVATSLGLDVRGGTVRAEGELDFRGTLNVDRDVPVGFQAIHLAFTLDTDASDEELATRLGADGHEVVGFDRVKRDDILNLKSLTRRARGCDAVVHAAAIPSNDLGTPEEIMAVNVAGTFNVLRTAEAIGTPVVYFSSVQALGLCERIANPASLPVGDDYSGRPVGTYGQTKRFAGGDKRVESTGPARRPLAVDLDDDRALGGIETNAKGRRRLLRWGGPFRSATRPQEGRATDDQQERAHRSILSAIRLQLRFRSGSSAFCA